MNFSSGDESGFESTGSPLLSSTPNYHSMNSRSDLELFFSSPAIAMVGVSRDKKKFGNRAFEKLRANAKHTVIPVNPQAAEINGVKCLPDLAALPPEVQSVVLMVPKEKVTETLKSALDKGIHNIWIQQDTETLAALQLAAASKANVISGLCILMFADPVKGIHRFHRGLKGLFGSLPR